MSRIKKFINSLRFSIIAPFLDLNDRRLAMDIDRWMSVLHISGDRKQGLKKLLSEYKEFRNLFILRNRRRPAFCRMVRLLYRPLDSLYIMTEDIGGGLFIQHGFSTYIAARSIGENCWINQLVNIGYKDNGKPPIIGNNVAITCGAVVLGDISVGDNAIIGANSVVTKDVEPGAVMGGVPARRLK